MANNMLLSVIKITTNTYPFCKDPNSKRAFLFILHLGDNIKEKSHNLNDKISSDRN